MRILVLTLMMSFLSQSAFGADSMPGKLRQDISDAQENFFVKVMIKENNFGKKQIILLVGEFHCHNTDTELQGLTLLSHFNVIGLEPGFFQGFFGPHSFFRSGPRFIHKKVDEFIYNNHFYPEYRNSLCFLNKYGPEKITFNSEEGLSELYRIKGIPLFFTMTDFFISSIIVTGFIVFGDHLYPGLSKLGLIMLIKPYIDFMAFKKALIAPPPPECLLLSEDREKMRKRDEQMALNAVSAFETYKTDKIAMVMGAAHIYGVVKRLKESGFNDVSEKLGLFNYKYRPVTCILKKAKSDYPEDCIYISCLLAVACINKYFPRQ